MQLFYSATLTAGDTTFVFDKDESRHIIKVLRKSTGDKLHITNGKGDLFEAEISLPSDSRCTVRIASVMQFESPPYSLHLAVAPTKMNERYEWFLEKATEIGIARITPVICDRSERKIVKADRFEKIILSAMKQSGQYFLPVLDEPMDFDDFAAADFAGQKFIAHCEPTGKATLKQSLTPNQDVTILIGPEGDFSPKEIQLALQNGFVPVSLGETRLRTETAALVACHSVAYANE